MTTPSGNTPVTLYFRGAPQVQVCSNWSIERTSAGEIIMLRVPQWAGVPPDESSLTSEGDLCAISIPIDSASDAIVRIARHTDRAGEKYHFRVEDK